ncbi:odorant receptor 104-1 [Danio rerio]|uniref:Olfactory receptor n=1 Tax=Danio rerio TaxID=7955 RepID=Q2PRL9_DANRE|nr:odorant receptor 104-1 [Danio rerio]ABC43248.1 odorant receptor [Danio rerio]|eukprot:NP_001082909.1 odorant receptor, family C, subfamily 104, member 1 [Danio rerio]
MSQANDTTASTVTEFFIMGFPGLLPKYYSLTAALLFCIYIAVITGNSLIVVLFVIERSLHKPMYIIMLSLSVSDICFCTVALPKVISRYWFNDGFISFYVCLFQRQLIHYFGTLNSLIMMLMALDRYLAICHPLRYPVLMTNRTMRLLVGFSWVTAMIAPSISLSLTLKLPFCGPNMIAHCFCDSLSMNQLACADASFYNLIAFGVAMFVLLVPLSFIIFSYASILVSVLQIANAKGRLKALSTCATQLTIISIYYVPRFAVYITSNVPNAQMDKAEKIALVMFYSLLPPLMNPFIYFIRIREIRQVFLKCCAQRKRMISSSTTVSK